MADVMRCGWYRRRGVADLGLIGGVGGGGRRRPVFGALWFASKAYVVFDIDYRLSPPPTWREAPADVGCAVGWVKENAARYGVDPPGAWSSWDAPPASTWRC